MKSRSGISLRNKSFRRRLGTRTHRTGLGVPESSPSPVSPSVSPPPERGGLFFLCVSEEIQCSQRSRSGRAKKRSPQTFRLAAQTASLGNSGFEARVQPKPSVLKSAGSFSRFRDFDPAPVSRFPGPGIGEVFEFELDGISGERRQVEVDVLPLVSLDGLFKLHGAVYADLQDPVMAEGGS